MSSPIRIGIRRTEAGRVEVAFLRLGQVIPEFVFECLPSEAAQLSRIAQWALTGAPIKRVSIESPYSDDVARNTKYAWLCLADSLARGEAPYASHLLYTQILNDSAPTERRHGLDASNSWRRSCDLIAIYQDLGISPGMQEAIALATEFSIPLEYRKLEGLIEL